MLGMIYRFDARIRVATLATVHPVPNNLDWFAWSEAEFVIRSAAPGGTRVDGTF
jgi:hypothetical protein